MVQLLFLLYNTVSTTIMKVYDCSDPINDKRYLTRDMTIECDTPRHNAVRALGVVCWIFYILGIPLVRCSRARVWDQHDIPGTDGDSNSIV